MNTATRPVFRSDRVESLWAHARPGMFIGNLFRRRHLIQQFTVREVRGRYRSSFLGITWGLIIPLLTLAVYTFVFSVVYHIQWPDGTPNPGVVSFALHMFSGMIVINVFIESVQSAPNLIVSNPNFVKKVVFPLEVLPMSLVGSSLFHALLSMMIAVAGQLIFHHTLHATILLLPLVFIPLIAMSLGACWILASLGVFIRDIGNVIGVVTNLLFLATPVMYPVSMISPKLRLFIWINPLSGLVVNARGFVNDGLMPNWGPLVYAWIFAGVVLVAGYAWFMKIKRAFADVI